MMGFICDCGLEYQDEAGIIACANNNHGRQKACCIERESLKEQISQQQAQIVGLVDALREISNKRPHINKKKWQYAFDEAQIIANKALSNPDIAKYQRLLDEHNRLITAVASKFPGESSFETALRYIENAEKHCNGPEQQINGDGDV